jgi:dihydrofolate reductase
VLASRQLAPAPVSTVQVHRSGFEPFKSDLENRYKGDVWVLGGGRLMRSFLEGDSKLKMELHLIPLLLGSGIGPFGGYQSPVPLRAIDAIPLSRGVVRLTFERNSKAPVDVCCP